VYQNLKEYYIPTLRSTHPPQHVYGRIDAYQLCEGFRFQYLLQTQGGFSRDNQLVYGGHNAYRSYERVEGDDGDTDDDANIRDEDEGDVVMIEVHVMRELVVMREVYMIRINMASHQTMVQPILHTIMIEVLKGRVLTHK
jgi:hypothetical protein